MSGDKEVRGATRSGKVFRASNRGHYSSLAELRKAHHRLFVRGPRLFFAERRILGRKVGLAELTLRLPYGIPDVGGELRRAMSVANRAYAQLDGWGYDVVLTANAVLVGGTEVNPSYSLYFGQDFSDARERSITEGGLVRVEDEEDLDKVPTDFGLEEFSRHFERVFRDTSVRVHSLVNLVYLIRKPVGGDQISTGSRIHNILY